MSARLCIPLDPRIRLPIHVSKTTHRDSPEKGSPARLLTIPVLKDDAHGASTARLLAAVHDPQWLHLGVHEGALLHTAGQRVGSTGAPPQARGVGGAPLGPGMGLTRLPPAGCWDRAETAGGTGPPCRSPGACTYASSPWFGAWWSSASSPSRNHSAPLACSVLPPGGDSGKAAVGASLRREDGAVGGEVGGKSTQAGRRVRPNLTCFISTFTWWVLPLQ